MSQAPAERASAVGRGSAGDSFYALAELTRDFVATAARDGQIRFLNHIARQRLGIPDAASLEPAHYVQADDRPVLCRLVSDALDAGQAQPARLGFVHQESGRVIPLSCRLFRLGTAENPEDGLAGIIGSARHESDGDGLPIAQDAAAAVRLSEMFTGVVGHDLRNPLNVILTCAHFVIQRTDDDLTRTTVQRIVSSGHRMQRMIDQLLDVTRIRAGGGIPLQVSAVDLRPLIEQAAQEVCAAHAECEIELSTDGDTTGVWDTNRVTQMISNLLGNAAEHGAPPKGVRIAVDGSAPDDVLITVENAGAIAPELVAVLFNPFRIAHQKRHKSRGLGLGLYVSRQIAVAHGGAIEVQSTEPAGTTFRISLPRRYAEVQPLAGASGLGADDMAILEMLATAPKATSVTAQLFGAVALHERVPHEYWHLFDRYVRLLDLALDHQTYKTDNQELSDELREIAEQLGRLGAGAREVAQLHARALRQKTRAVSVLKAQAFTAEGRLVSFELMGHLLSFYRRRSGLAEPS